MLLTLHFVFYDYITLASEAEGRGKLLNRHLQEFSLGVVHKLREALEKEWIHVCAKPYM